MNKIIVPGIVIIILGLISFFAMDFLNTSNSDDEISLKDQSKQINIIQESIISQERKVILASGRLHSFKQFDVLIRAYSMIKNNYRFLLGCHQFLPLYL